MILLKEEPYFVEQPIKRTFLQKNDKPLLRKLDLELTERCNNNCIHCCINLPKNDVKARKRELTAEEIKSILKEAAGLGCVQVRFTGGEPLLRRDFEELYVFARKLGLRVMLFTNATLITSRLATLFKRIPLLEKIEVTVYGMKKGSCEAVTRTAGSYKASRNGIRLLMEHKIPFVVKGALLPGNKDEIDEFESWAAGIPWMGGPPSFSMFFDLRCRRNDKRSESIKKLRLTPEETIQFLVRRKDSYLKEMKQFCANFMRPPGDELFSCGAGCAAGCVDAYGNFQLCMGLRHPDTVCNLHRGSLKEALENFFPKVRKIKATHAEYLKRCARCFLKGLCDQCPAKSWLEHGTLDTPVEYFCDVAHVKARYLGLIADHEKAWEVRDWQKRIVRFSGQ
jgi:radical SAM protein with 4Fe4S-binding SPASM domain